MTRLIPAVFRQWLNVASAVAMPLTTYLAFGRGVSFDMATAGQRGTPLIEPAGYAFVVWGAIYAGAVVYAVGQAMPARRFDSLTARIGWWTASAFLGVCAWLVAARFRLLWLTVGCIVWIALSLLPAFLALPRPGRADRPSTYLFVSLPLSIFFGWVTVATFANLAAALKESGVFDGAEQAWTIALIAVACAVALRVLLISSGNVAYGFTVAWALIAIVVANSILRGPYPAIVIAASAGTLLALGGLLYARDPHV